jgi:hypothetical protein
MCKWLHFASERATLLPRSLAAAGVDLNYSELTQSVEMVIDAACEVEPHVADVAEEDVAEEDVAEPADVSPAAVKDEPDDDAADAAVKDEQDELAEAQGQVFELFVAISSKHARLINQSRRTLSRPTVRPTFRLTRLPRLGPTFRMKVRPGSQARRRAGRLQSCSRKHLRTHLQRGRRFGYFNRVMFTCCRRYFRMLCTFWTQAARYLRPRSTSKDPSTFCAYSVHVLSARSVHILFTFCSHLVHTLLANTHLYTLACSTLRQHSVHSTL